MCCNLIGLPLPRAQTRSTSPSAIQKQTSLLSKVTMMKNFAAPGGGADGPNTIKQDGGGMSRAAKKRAKKKQKKQPVELPVDEPDYNEDDDDDDEPAPPPIKKQKLPPTAVKKHPVKKQKKNDGDSKMAPAEGGDQIIPDEPNDEVDGIVQELVSKLTPAQILLLADISDTTAISTVGTEEVDARDLLQEITAKQRAKCVLQSILGSMDVEEFYDQYWEKEPLLVQNMDKNRLDGFLSIKSIKKMTEDQPMAYGRDLNVTKYEQGLDGVKRRITLDQIGQEDGDFIVADPKDLWSNYENGCTIRLLCPHQNSESTHSLLSTLELEWGCMVGANAYLTPPGASQGFSPHYDDIDAYILQLEGKKHWKVYAPLNKQETLPRVSSSDYTEEDLKDVEPALDVVLEAGDLLYLPRGWIHQACTLQEHSLHLTVSAMQQWAWVDYLELLIPQALGAAGASEKSTSLREGLPRNFLDYMGAVHDTPEDPEELKVLAKREQPAGEDDATKRLQQQKDRMRALFMEEAKKRIMRVTKEAISMMDAACDQIGKSFLSDRLPPALTPAELLLTSENRSESGGKIWPNTMCRLVRPGIARLVLEDGKAVLYQCADNSRVYHGNPLSPLEFEMDDAPAIEAMVTTVEPHWIMVKDLIHDDIEDKMELAQALYDEGILAIMQTEKPDKSVQTK
jgi:lysine-specific demethylase/histidyl-hydroxylase NO66